jgi:hypothetical protein
MNLTRLSLLQLRNDNGFVIALIGVLFGLAGIITMTLCAFRSIRRYLPSDRNRDNLVPWTDGQ